MEYEIFPEMPELYEKMRQIHAQLHWETRFLDMALKNGIVALHAGTTMCLDAGKLLDRLSQNQVNCCVINLPQDSQSSQYIGAHLRGASDLFHNGRFILTECNPDKGGSLNPFFDALEKMAITLNKDTSHWEGI